MKSPPNKVEARYETGPQQVAPTQSPTSTAAGGVSAQSCPCGCGLQFFVHYAAAGPPPVEYYRRDRIPAVVLTVPVDDTPAGWELHYWQDGDCWYVPLYNQWALPVESEVEAIHRAASYLCWKRGYVVAGTRCVA